MTSMATEFLLPFIAFCTSLFTAVIGTGGGIMLIAVLPDFLPIKAIIPVHASVQLSSNISRAAFAFSEIRWKYILPFLCGSIFGAGTGSLLLSQLHWDYLPVILGIVLLLLIWFPSYFKISKIPGSFFSTGAIKAFSTLFVGVAGPLSIPLLVQEKLNGNQVIVTNAVFAAIVHILKIIIFGFLGFVFVDYFFLIFGMIIGSIIGSYAGTKLRSRVSEKVFKKIFKGTVSILALRMIYKAIL